MPSVCVVVHTSPQNEHCGQFAVTRVFVLKGKRIQGQPGTDVDLSQVPFDLTPEERRLGMSGLMQRYLGDAIRAIGDPSRIGQPIKRKHTTNSQWRSFSESRARIAWRVSFLWKRC
jgi:hypothetical protein